MTAPTTCGAAIRPCTHGAIAIPIGASIDLVTTHSEYEPTDPEYIENAHYKCADRIDGEYWKAPAGATPWERGGVFGQYSASNSATPPAGTVPRVMQRPNGAGAVASGWGAGITSAWSICWYAFREYTTTTQYPFSFRNAAWGVSATQYFGVQFGTNTWSVQSSATVPATTVAYTDPGYVAPRAASKYIWTYDGTNIRLYINGALSGTSGAGACGAVTGLTHVLISQQASALNTGAGGWRGAFFRFTAYPGKALDTAERAAWTADCNAKVLP